ncbi:uncharacterized protein N7446_005574 [Penicillium canescens]|uniref:Uncharacterized protein n=1 Tax=Penicillium canescens TaxID=5083 RepID=A0AAD6II58_PENCN|nr:uncharacterized protein N7446_005574 [Penicillium canescens]KAJ6050946.1 hypothetical protein N7460_001480 [Penicillium canescens]KAJ6061454.1 hypothetical protein N7446_005574 [Penicillium canescens]
MMPKQEKKSRIGTVATFAAIAPYPASSRFDNLFFDLATIAISGVSLKFIDSIGENVNLMLEVVNTSVKFSDMSTEAFHFGRNTFCYMLQIEAFATLQYHLSIVDITRYLCKLFAHFGNSTLSLICFGSCVWRFHCC